MRDLIVFGSLGYSFGALLATAIVRGGLAIVPAMLFVGIAIYILASETLPK